MNERQHQFVETEISDWKDVFKLSDKLFSQLLFRGQADKKWEINSSLERLLERLHPNYIDKAIVPNQEKQMLREFQWKYPLFKTKTLDDKNYIEWLSIMQHYGAATRLVDFTDSFFVATFLAIYESWTDAAVWSINKNVLASKIFDEYREKFNTHHVSSQDLDEYSLQIANQVIENSFNYKQNTLLLIRPKNSNERLYRQQGLFIMPTNIETTFMENLFPLLSYDKPLFIDFTSFLKLSDSYKQDQFTLVKINIPKQLHLAILKNLREMNINSEMLFPGIEGLAKSMNYSKFNLK